MRKRLFPCLFCTLVFSMSAWAEQSLPKVTILATGGTIAGRGATPTTLTGYSPGELLVEEVIDAVPSLKDFAQISAEQVVNIPSRNMTIDVMLRLAKRINVLLAADDTDGIVVTHGSDTQEETAYFLTLTVRSEKPVVTVGSMRPPTTISPDGPLNLLQAVSVAGSKNAMGKGVLLVMNGQISCAREVTKSSTIQPETFRSHDLGFLGYMVHNKPVFYRESLRKHTTESEFDVSNLGKLPKVEIVYNYAGAGLEALNGIIAVKPDGIIVAGTGNGNPHDTMRKVLEEAARNGIVVVRSSRVGTGSVPRLASDDASGFVAGDNLIPQKARILLMLALTKTKDIKEVQRIFDTY